jgi:hypothetical protein
MEWRNSNRHGTCPQGGASILQSDLERLVPADGSLMPTGLETAVTPEALAALLTWLRGR